MPLKDDVAKYIAQGKEAVSEYVEAYKDKEKQRKESKEHEKQQTSSEHVIDDKEAAATSSTATAVPPGPGQSTEVAPAAEVARPSSALARYKDRLAIKLPTGQFDIGKSCLS